MDALGPEDEKVAGLFGRRPGGGGPGGGCFFKILSMLVDANKTMHQKRRKNT